MKITILRWGSMTAAALSATWVILLAALVVRCESSGKPFPVLAKFSRFHAHLMLTDYLLKFFPVFALLALCLIGAAWYRERSFRPICSAAINCAVLVSMSLVVILFNPGGYFSWFLS